VSGISMDHNDIRHRLSEYIDGSVTGEERAAIDAHLKTCQQCSSALEELRKTIEHIKTIEKIEPPAWMTQKIMATVRAEAVEKKGFFHRFFFPLRIKLPIQAIAVLFLAVTGFYIYQNIQRGERVSEAPIQEFAAKKPAPPTGTAQDKLAKADIPSRSKSVQQTPAYKALDMKQEYETPPPPAQAEKIAGPPASSPAEHPALAGNEAASGKRSAEPQAAVLARKKMPEQAGPPAGAALQAEGKQGSAALKGNLKAASATDSASSASNITVAVTDLETAERDTEATIRQLGGAITKKEQFVLKRIFAITLSANRVDDLLTQLNRIGEVKEKRAPLESKENRIEFKIELVKTPK
jgi:Predicted integral membrane protein (DUF2275)/Putative zinc-finger